MSTILAICSAKKCARASAILALAADTLKLNHWLELA
jgi:hypothetical protein